MNSSVSIRDNKGDVIGVGIDGSGNIIAKDIIIYQVKRDFNLSPLTREYLERHSNTEDDFKGWLTGFPLSLPSIYQKREYRRKNVISLIKDKLDENNRILLLGESGTSKTTLLMEIMCDYLEKDYTILYSFGNEELKNENELTDTLEGLAEAGNKILVAIDNIHDKKTSLIFHVINNLSTLSNEKIQNVHFILAARIPEFDWVLEKNLWNDSDAIENIEKLFDEDYKYPVPYFELDEVKDFIVKYKDFLYIDRKYKSIEQNANEIFDDTDGYPIMVRFSVLNEGLDAHVKKMYIEYLVDNNMPNLNKIKTVILNSLFDISNIILTDELLQKFNLLDTAEDIKNTIIKKTGDAWKTIHPKWDMQLFRHIFSLKYNLNLIENSFKETLKEIILNKNIGSFEEFNILDTIYYTFTVEKVISLNIIEKSIDLNVVEKNLDYFSKVLFYTHVVGFPYYQSNRIEDAISFLDKAIELNPHYDFAYYNKGLSLSTLGKDEEAIREYDKAIEINPYYVEAFVNKGLSLYNLGRYEEAIREYDKAIEINPKEDKSYYNKGNSLHNLGRYEEAIREYDKAIEINPDNINAFLGKSFSLLLLERNNEAKQLIDKVLEMEPQNEIAMELEKQISKE